MPDHNLSSAAIVWLHHLDHWIVFSAFLLSLIHWKGRRVEGIRLALLTQVVGIVLSYLWIATRHKSHVFYFCSNLMELLGLGLLIFSIGVLIANGGQKPGGVPEGSAVIPNPGSREAEAFLRFRKAMRTAGGFVVALQCLGILVVSIFPSMGNENVNPFSVSQFIFSVVVLNTFAFLFAIFCWARRVWGAWGLIACWSSVVVGLCIWAWDVIRAMTPTHVNPAIYYVLPGIGLLAMAGLLFCIQAIREAQVLKGLGMSRDGDVEEKPHPDSLIPETKAFRRYRKAMRLAGGFVLAFQCLGLLVTSIESQGPERDPARFAFVMAFNTAVVLLGVSCCIGKKWASRGLIVYWSLVILFGILQPATVHSPRPWGRTGSWDLSLASFGLLIGCSGIFLCIKALREAAGWRELGLPPDGLSAADRQGETGG